MERGWIHSWIHSLLAFLLGSGALLGLILIFTGENNREIKIHVCGVRQTANVSWEFLKIENKHIKAVEDDS